jgi:DNA-binding MarR family transcriptional regulator/GNAT superfamily N-acetyltransferase
MVSVAATTQVRRFNRLVTERIGALDAAYMGRDRPLGEARLLWEIGLDGSPVARLRARLELDSGYLSRLLRSLEADGLVTVTADGADRRSRIARLTPRGRREWQTLDQRSDQLATSLLAPLSGHQRDRLVAAMGEVERLLTAAAVRLVVADPEADDARRCLERYADELNRRSKRTFDPAVGATAAPDEVRPPAGVFLIAYLHGDPVGCGAVKHPPGRPAAIKRMWIDPAARGLGLGRRLLHELEAHAERAGATVARIETNRDLGEALALYASEGWTEVEPFNDEPYADCWLEKPLA